MTTHTESRRISGKSPPSPSVTQVVFLALLSDSRTSTGDLDTFHSFDDLLPVTGREHCVR